MIGIEMKTKMMRMTTGTDTLRLLICPRRERAGGGANISSFLKYCSNLNKEAVGEPFLTAFEFFTARLNLAVR